MRLMFIVVILYCAHTSILTAGIDTDDKTIQWCCITKHEALNVAPMQRLFCRSNQAVTSHLRGLRQSHDLEN